MQVFLAVLAALTFFAAGFASAGRPDMGSAVFFPVLPGALALWAYSRLNLERGAQPLKQLKPFRQYTIVQVVEKWDRSRLLVVKHHVDYGHWEYRLADLPWTLMVEPQPGEELWVDGRGLHFGRLERTVAAGARG